MIDILDCGGSYREMGKAQGLRYKDRIDDIFRALLKSEYTPRVLRNLGNVPIFRTLLTLVNLKNLPSLVWKMICETPSQFQRLNGIARGTSLGLPTLLAINSIETLSTRLNFILGCSALAISGERLKPSLTPLLAYNHDFPDFFEDFIILRRSRPVEGFASIQITYPTLAGAIAGINDQGVAITLNHAFAVEKGESGIPPTILVQDVLDHCGSVDGAVKFLKKTHPACGSLVTLLDKNGRMAAVELSRSRIAVRNGKNGFLLTLNQYETPELKEIEVPQGAYFDPKKYPPAFHGIPVHHHNWARSRRFAQMLKGRGRFDLDEIETFLKDHGVEETPDHGTICRHHDTATTIASATLHPAEGFIRVLRGRPCEGEYETYPLLAKKAAPLKAQLRKSA